MAIDSSSLKRIHFVGMKGVAMTALAIYCKEKGFAVTGSDIDEDFPTKESLDKAGITPLLGFFADHLLASEKPDLVIYTGAHNGRDNIEVQTARELGIETMPHGRALGYFMDGSTQISVAGSHGKTTTTAMIATILSSSGQDPSYAVGCGPIIGLSSSGHYGKGQAFVAEADEYITDPGHDQTPRFLWQHPNILVVTNIDYDHPDAYPSLTAVQQAFMALFHQQQGLKTTLVNADDPESTVLLKKSDHEIITYGLSKKADVHPSHIRFEEGKTVFDLTLKDIPVGSFELMVAGVHNVKNACAAIGACVSLGLSWEDIRKGLATFGGTKRRFEHIGSVGTIKVYDDYAHHPHEIEATLKGAREWFPKRRIITIFQPHTFSRTKALLPEFAKCFADSDIVCIPDIYASAREHENLGMHSTVLVEAIKKNKQDIFYTKDEKETLHFLKSHTQEGDIILTMGAGDIYWWGKHIIEQLTINN